MTRRANREKALRRQVDRIGRISADLSHKSSQLTLLLLVIVGLTIAAALLLFVSGNVVGVFIAFGGGAVIIGFVVSRQNRLKTHLDTLTYWRNLKQNHIARLNLDWPQLPETLDISPENRHPLEVDLDLIGERSLLRLVNTAETTAGHQRLRQWLATTQPHPTQMNERQKLVAELAPRHLLRDRISLAAKLAHNSRGKPGEGLVEWIGSEGDEIDLSRWLIVLTLSAALNWFLFIGSVLGWFGPYWLWSFVVYVGLASFALRKVENIFIESAWLRDRLWQLIMVFQLLENYSHAKTPAFKALCKPLLGDDDRPSKLLRRVIVVVSGTALMKNGIIWIIINALVPWGAFFAHLYNRQKSMLRQKLPGWLDVWFEVEAVSSLANWAYLNPERPFLDVDDAFKQVLESAELGHPLIPTSEKVTNDFSINHVGSINLITGSNMAGKSTFLRTIGINLILGYAGTVVDASLLRVRPLQLFSCIRVSDSIADGFSYFYAEVRRLKSLLTGLDSAEPPIIYFIDEIFRGTNNRERLIGSKALISAMSGKNGVGLISTHDLELVKLADSDVNLRNYHFRETVVDSRMVFDYKLRSGPCPTTNALHIMQLEGLPVKWNRPTVEAQAAPKE